MSAGANFFQSDQSIPAFTGATLVNGTSLGTAALQLAPPPNAVGFYLYADGGNADLLRFTLNNASVGATTGIGLEAARSEGFVPYGGTLSIAMASGTGAYRLLWIMRT